MCTTEKPPINEEERQQLILRRAGILQQVKGWRDMMKAHQEIINGLNKEAASIAKQAGLTQTD